MVDNKRFVQRHAVGGQPVLLATEMEALGTDYQANGYTTPAQADEIGEDLALGPGHLLLDIGAGCGFPGLYLAKKHGCAVISLDPVAEGVRVARQRGSFDGLSELTWAIQADAESIPLMSGSVDAIVQADVLC
ncbi:MAG: class I SAM-dependent methyltransferase [Actinomycetia bacterium]|nr:class I SAM-dependent methyltransferase [Actinomycetes bacterium]MCP3911623.1 class I SAM-dependent methyltransferase [Actinomycetes bacterium]MCP4086839.1 class I SAM-dependent methyltransferase [Actinomycetes bacterium]